MQQVIIPFIKEITNQHLDKNGMQRSEIISIPNRDNFSDEE